MRWVYRVVVRRDLAGVGAWSGGVELGSEHGLRAIHRVSACFHTYSFSFFLSFSLFFSLSFLFLASSTVPYHQSA